ncbi:MAG: gamma-glutamyl-gamma-aminobutyrate hydrolase family protein [Bryobacterales bacterium]|nr:gamma-glutamyl-gamma-aminobutyrate hydrolase family protein [Bryobacterales bacterium]
MRRVGISYRFEEKYPPYRDAVLAVGLAPVAIVPPGVQSLKGLDGLLLAGGTDLNPALYGQVRDSETEDADEERDAMEIRLLQEALRIDMPVLCICRGLQLFNVALGGDLIQHLEQTELHRQRGVTDAHPVQAIGGTRLGAIVGTESFEVNSRHHQAAGRIAPKVVVSAYSADGVIEGLELAEQRFAVAVQWHPEDRVPWRKQDTNLFREFAVAVGEKVP